jgi:UDPglucose 6-dehydrogenase
MVMGLGKLGLPLATVIAEQGYSVYGYDKSKSLIESLQDNCFVTTEPGLTELLNNDPLDLKFDSQIPFEVANKLDVIFIVVPTPSLFNGEFSNEYLIDAINYLGPKLRFKTTRTVICIVSTVMPGSCDGELRERIEFVCDQKLGDKIGLCYHPEFIALGSVIKNLKFPDFHLIGRSQTWVTDVVRPVFKAITKNNPPFKEMNLLEAELVKISINNYVTMKITFANSIMLLSQKLSNCDIHTITSAIGLDSRIGSKYLTAGVPFGGPCFPRDTRAMQKIFKDMNIANSFSKVTSQINNDFSDFLVLKILDLCKKSDRIGILGVSYKSGTPVIEESPGVYIAQQLTSSGKKVYYYDDENANILDERITPLTLDSILDICDFFVFTRSISDSENIKRHLKDHGKNFLDLWNQ